MIEPNLEKFKQTVNNAKSWDVVSGEVYANNYYYHLDLTESREIQTELWNKIVFPEFNNIYLQIRRQKNNGSITNQINEDAKGAHLAGILWNEKFEHFRFYNSHVYYLELRPGLSQPDLIFRKYSVEYFCKEISRTNFDAKREFAKVLKKNNRLQTVLGLMILLILISYIVFLLVNK